MGNLISWVEIPASDIERAAKFYGTLFDKTIKVGEFNGRKTGMLPGASDGVGFSLNQTEGFTPGKDGVYVYLSCGDEDLETIMARVEPAGGTLVEGKIDIGGDMGFYATIRDTEGNTLGLYSQK